MAKALTALASGFRLLGPARCAAYSRDELESHRRGTIQAFENAYEISRKTLRRHLLEIGATEAEVAAKNLYRAAHENGLIDNPERWFAHHQARNQTSHHYDEAEAAKVLTAARKFLRDARALLRKMRQ